MPHRLPALPLRGRKAPVAIRNPRPLASLCEAAQCSHWVVRSEAELRCHGFAVTEGETGGVEPRPYTPPADSAMAGRKRCRKKILIDGQRLYLS